MCTSTSSAKHRLGMLALVLFIVVLVAVLTGAGRPGTTRPAKATPVTSLDDTWVRILVALVILMLLAEGSRSLTEFIKSFAAYVGGCTWALPGADQGTLTEENRARRAFLIYGSSILSGMFVAGVAGVDVLRVMATGVIQSRWWCAETDACWGTPHGIILTGLLASLGSAFIHDVIGIVQAIRNQKRQAAGQVAPGQQPVNPTTPPK